jgi:hypothetical protein
MPSEFDISGDTELANLVGPGLPLRRSTPFSAEELEDMGTYLVPRNRAVLPDRLRPIGETPSASDEPSVGSEEIPSVSKPYSKKRGKNGGKKSRTRRNKKRQIRRKTNKRYSRRR